MADGNIHKAPHTEQKEPFNIDAEQAILGAILFDNEIFYRVSGFLKGEHFYDPVHQLIYVACEKLISSGRLASPVTLNTYLADNPAMGEIGGSRYLSDLAMNVPSTAGAWDYARVVFDLSVSRGLVRLGGEMIDRARSADIDDDPQTQVQTAEAELYKLAETGKYGGGFVTFESALAEAINIANAAYERGGGLAGVSTGLVDIDKHMGGLHKSDLIILAGRPSMGKTALVTNIAVNAAKAYRPERQADGTIKAGDGAVVGFFSLEMSADQLAGRILSEFSEIPSDRIRRGDIDQSDFERIYEAAQTLNDIPLYIDDTGGLSIAQLAARARRLKRQHGLNLLIIDYLQLLSGSKKSGENRVQEVTEITVGLKALAKELEVPVIALSQLSRQVEQREDKRPQLSDLRESGSIEQDADVVLFVYREEYYLSRAEPREGTPEHLQWQEDCDKAAGKAEVIIGKQRHGPIGNVKLAFDASIVKFGNLAQTDRYEDDRF
ncbi:replicative DNA helicase [Aquisalinus flavus]|uniref:Replicative DNA helicase n=1 Tax=Aquisalinus flavus TaxID=1526572 RepID=A0A8J2V672_9PROT|nr:replicative DNA helicase [Aquisalinus flavus]MBD0427429.1 replicative DNA helicase [Aquisalinus flavus]UNE47232.1 replicative DNA helicase [Aquisalinus flavus]GGD00941.1 replicative DNA helicase [Aquisalinus flavus]